MMADTTVIGTVLDHILTVSSKKQTPGIKIKFEYPSVSGTGLDVVYADLWLTDNTIPRVLDTLQDAFNWTGKDILELNGTKILAGKEASLVIYEEEGVDGNIYTKVRYINAIGGSGGLRQIADTDAKAIAKRLQGKILQHRQSKPAPAQTAPKAPVEDDESDLGF